VSDGVLQKVPHWGYCCYYCGAFSAGEDHIPPLRLVWQKIQGGDTLAGLEFISVPAYTPCNSRLGSKPLMTLETRAAYLRALQGGAA
jgi:hypothetical protein